MKKSRFSESQIVAILKEVVNRPGFRGGPNS